MSHGAAADGGWLELRAETTESVTGSSGGGVLAPPPDLDGASAPDPFAARPRPEEPVTDAVVSTRDSSPPPSAAPP